ncbi:restriction endonuclease [Streptomyces thermoviolaceus]|uniref:restriction endonuclease n=1 Tax=Streptomyces thermoviolaceus TaxID=1952 RepID=UPI003570B7B8
MFRAALGRELPQRPARRESTGQRPGDHLHEDLVIVSGELPRHSGTNLFHHRHCCAGCRRRSSVVQASNNRRLLSAVASADGTAWRNGAPCRPARRCARRADRRPGRLGPSGWDESAFDGVSAGAVIAARSAYDVETERAPKRSPSHHVLFGQVRWLGAPSRRRRRRLCRRDGCTDVLVTGRRGDLGADVTGCLADGRKLVVQCKKYAPHRSVSSQDMHKSVGTARPEHGADVRCS